MAKVATAFALRSAQHPDVLARFFHGLSDPTRLKILGFLLDGPKTAGEIVRYAGRRQPSVSAHLTCLRFCGYVEARREGRNVRYALIDRRVRRLLELGERYLRENAERILECQVIGSERGVRRGGDSVATSERDPARLRGRVVARPPSGRAT